MNTLESKLFSWDSWDEDSPFSAYFYDCLLNVPIGDHKVGEKIVTIFINGESSTITLETAPGNLETYELSFSVGELVTASQEHK